MRIVFENKEPQIILNELIDALDGRKLGELVSFELDDNDLNVTIQKMGKSSLNFTHQKKSDQVEWELTKEKIAFSHKAFKNDVLDKLTKVIESIGGKVVN